MKIPMREGGVPFAVTYKKIIRKPKMTRERRFVGIMQLAKNLLVKAIETVEQAAFETKIETIEAGESVSVHWAITVGNPFDNAPDKQMKNLVAFRIDNENELPQSGVHFEVITPLAKNTVPATPVNGAAKTSNLVQDLTPEQFELLRRRQQEGGGIKEMREVGGTFRRPANPAYDPRPIKTIDEETDDETVEDAHEEPANLDGAGSLGEDN